MFFHVLNLLNNFLICTHLSNIKLNYSFFFALNFETLYLFKFFFLIFDQERQFFGTFLYSLIGQHYQKCYCIFPLVHIFCKKKNLMRDLMSLRLDTTNP
jgi:hypothetical protein